jgi:V/A-type H+-transporting ATPase subunit C
MKYGYSSTRTKAMESKLIDVQTMKSIADARDIDSILAILFQTDYNASIIKFGGQQISNTMLDFAISDNMTSRVNKLVEITPKDDKHILRKLIARWDLNNVKMALEAVDRKTPFDSISMYIISSGEFGQPVIKDIVKSENIDVAFAKLIHNRQYRGIMTKAYAAYKKNRNIMDAIAAIDAEHYRELGELALELQKGKHEKPALLLKLDIDMRNIITLLRAKRNGMKIADVSARLIKNGSVETRILTKIYNGSDDVASFASKITVFDLKNAIESYKGNGQMLSFEISMRNQIFNISDRMLRSSVLSLGVLVDYVYLKEIEVFTLRALIKSKEYGLSKEEITRLVVWNL